MHSTGAPTVVMCDTEPLALEGFRVLLSGCEDLGLTAAETPAIRAVEAVRQTSPAVAPIDGEIGIHAALDRVRAIRACNPRCAGVICSRQLTEAGATGFLSKHAALPRLPACLRAVPRGGVWMHEFFRAGGMRARGQKAGFTPRGRQILELLEPGRRNKDLAETLGLRPGTVKVYLHRMFGKSDVRGRSELALAHLRARALPSLQTI